MKNLSFYKKTFFLVITIILSIFLISKFSLNLIKKEIINVVNSKQFEIFMSNQFKNKLQEFANKEMTDEEYIFYKENFKKIYIKLEPIFEDIKNEVK